MRLIMDNNELFAKICEGNAILITGSGAHINVETPDGNKFLNGKQLARYLYINAGIPEDEIDDDISNAAQTYMELKSANSLVEELKLLFNVGKIQNEHINLYNQNWKRIYTTNYDMVPMLATKEAGNKRIYPVTLSTKYNKQLLDKKLCIYINGYIDNLNEDTLSAEFKLTEDSYMKTTSFLKNHWGEIFNEDLETSSAIVVVGLSLEYDLDLKRFLKKKASDNRVFFIQSESISNNLKRKLERMGDVLPIGVERFSRDLATYSKTYIKTNDDKSFEYKSFEEHKAEYGIDIANTFNVYDMFMYGKICNNLWHISENKYDNIVYRDKIDKVIEDLDNGSKAIFIHANLGNGKTFFLEILKRKLENKNYKIFTLKESYESITSKEIAQIVAYKSKIIVIIENYYNYIDEIQRFALHEKDNIQFIFSSRSVMYDVRLREVCSILNLKQGDSDIINLNHLNDRELKRLSDIFNKNGFWGDESKLSNHKKIKLLGSKKYGNGQLQSILLYIIQSSFIKNKIEDLIKNISNEYNQKLEILILALLIKVMSLNIKPNEIPYILDINIAFDAPFVSDKNVKEIIDFSGDSTDFALKSAITAKFILQELDCNKEIIKALTSTAKYFNNFLCIKRCENILKNIVSFSHVKAFLVWNSNKTEYILEYYNKIKELQYYKENTFFWLQYAIACMNFRRYDLAQVYLQNAYAYFCDAHGNMPFQVDTQQAKLYLLIIMDEENCDIEDLFKKAHNLLMHLRISKKDNPVKSLLLFGLYTQNKFINKIKINNLQDTYYLFCKEAYNKLEEYIEHTDVDVENRKKIKHISDNILEKIYNIEIND